MVFHFQFGKASFSQFKVEKFDLRLSKQPLVSPTAMIGNFNLRLETSEIDV